MENIYPGPDGWPEVDASGQAVCVRYVAGYGGRWATPAALRVWMLLRIGGGAAASTATGFWGWSEPRCWFFDCHESSLWSRT